MLSAIGRCSSRQPEKCSVSVDSGSCWTTSPSVRGSGTGTAYRHFRNKHEIAVEVLGDATDQIVKDADVALAMEDPRLAVVAFFEAVAERQASDRGLHQALAGQGSDDDKARIWPQIVSTVTGLFDRAKRAGAIRADAAPEDVASIFAMLGVVFDMSRGDTRPVAPLPRPASRRTAGNGSAGGAGREPRRNSAVSSRVGPGNDADRPTFAFLKGR